VKGISKHAGSRFASGLSAVQGVAMRASLPVRIQALMFWAFNVGVAGIVLAALGDCRALLFGATALTLVATLLFTRATVGRAVEMLTAARAPVHRARAAGIG
jgi:hypothetical protein